MGGLGAVTGPLSAGSSGTLRPLLTAPVADAGPGFAPVVADGMHNALPGMVALPDGSLLMAYRRATNHVNAKGEIYKRTSTDGGATWSAGSVLYSDATFDVRDACLAFLPDGRLACTFFVSNATLSAVQLRGCRVIYSTDNGATWGAPQTPADTFTTSSACSGPIVAYNNRLIWPIYGKNGSDTLYSVAFLSSTDNGATWTQTDVASGPAAAKDLVEPNVIVAKNGDLLYLVRDDTADLIQIRRAVAGTFAVGGIEQTMVGKGAPRMIRPVSGRLIMVTRNAPSPPSGPAIIYYCKDGNGTTWTGPTVLDNRTSTYMQMVYVAMVEVEPGVIATVLANENAAQAVADIVVRYIFERPGSSPIGTEARQGGMFARRAFARSFPEGVCAPGNSLEVAAVATTVSGSMLACRVIVPKTGQLNSLWVPIGTASGNLKGVIYDVGATTSGVRHQIWVGNSVAPTPNWFLLGNPNIQVTAGDHLDLVVVPDNATVSIGRRILFASGLNYYPPSVANVNGCQFKTNWNFVSTFASPAADVTEAQAGATATVPVLVGQVI